MDWAACRPRSPEVAPPSFRDGAQAPDLRCAIAHRGISRFRVRCCASPRNDGRGLLAGFIATPSTVIVRLDRTIQYAAAFRFHYWRLWNTGSPAFAGDDDWEFGACVFIKRAFAIPRRNAPGLLCEPPSKHQRAQGRPGARCTRGLACKMRKQKRTRAYRFSGGSPAFPAQWLYGLYRALPGDRAFLPPSLRAASRET
jgi:hypothetical protein